MIAPAVIISYLLGVTFGDIVSQLRSAQTGQVLAPSDPGFEEKRKVMNAACTARPAVIVVPSTPLDVSNILKTATSANMEISVRSGGHSYTCTNLKENSQEILGF